MYEADLDSGILNTPSKLQINWLPGCVLRNAAENAFAVARCSSTKTGIFLNKIANATSANICTVEILVWLRF
jgi:hypothetical protein